MRRHEPAREHRRRAPAVPARAVVRGARELALQQIHRVRGRQIPREPRQRPVGEQLHLQRSEFVGELLKIALYQRPVLAGHVKHRAFQCARLRGFLARLGERVRDDARHHQGLGNRRELDSERQRARPAHGEPILLEPKHGLPGIFRHQRDVRVEGGGLDARAASSASQPGARCAKRPPPACGRSAGGARSQNSAGPRPR